MKLMTIAAILISTTQALALDNECTTKMKNAASFAIAQELAVPIQWAEVVDFQDGVWTEAVGNNSGSSTVEVRAGNRITRDLVFKSYVVYAKQIGTSADCNILEVKEVK